MKIKVIEPIYSQCKLQNGEIVSNKVHVVFNRDGFNVTRNGASESEFMEILFDFKDYLLRLEE